MGGGLADQAAVPGAHLRLRFADPVDLERAADVVVDGLRDEAARELRVPIDSRRGSIRAVLARLDDRIVDPTSLNMIEESIVDSSPAWRRLNELALQHYGDR